MWTQVHRTKEHKRLHNSLLDSEPWACQFSLSSYSYTRGFYHLYNHISHFSFFQCSVKTNTVKKKKWNATFLFSFRNAIYKLDKVFFFKKKNTFCDKRQERKSMQGKGKLYHSTFPLLSASERPKNDINVS